VIGLDELIAAPALSAHEGALQARLVGVLGPVMDDVRVDPLGNVIAKRKGTSGSGRAVLVTAHMDQIGFLVRDVTSTGFARVHPVGWVDARYYVAQRCRVGRADGGWSSGVLMAYDRPPHGRAPGDMGRAFQPSDLFIQPLEGAEAARFEIGAPVVLEDRAHLEGDLVVGGPLDDRVGIWCILRALERVPEGPDDLILAFTVQEEVGLRGASVVAHDTHVDAVLAVDVAGAHDVPDAEPRASTLALGGGVGLKVMDNRSISDPALLRGVERLARAAGIAHQRHVEPAGGTDAAALQVTGPGHRVLTISIPTRYLHTPTEVIARADLEACAALLTHALTTPVASLLVADAPATHDAPSTHTSSSRNDFTGKGTR